MTIYWKRGLFRLHLPWQRNRGRGPTHAGESNSVQALRGPCPTLCLAACAHQPVVSTYDPPGFFYGLLHGFISPFALVGSLFNDVRIYAFPNSGGWYDFGFLIGVASLFGGAASA